MDAQNKYRGNSWKLIVWQEEDIVVFDMGVVGGAPQGDVKVLHTERKYKDEFGPEGPRCKHHNGGVRCNVEGCKDHSEP